MILKGNTELLTIQYPHPEAHRAQPMDGRDPDVKPSDMISVGIASDIKTGPAIFAGPVF